MASDVLLTNENVIATFWNSSYVSEASYGAGKKSMIATVPGTATNIKVILRNMGVTSGSFAFDNILVIDLTKTFGAGKEPTLEEMDRLMARFPNSWFDGVKPVQTIETLYQEKANKVQEAWITPTLLNGWVAGSTPPAYMKDELGFVHLKGRVTGGTVGAAAFLLPVGYRPNVNSYFAAAANGLFGYLSVTSGGNVQLDSGSNINVNLITATFRAEV
ncbi:hypothetical protein SDC9_175879 [bioreactor metagenome]|uniref:Uncharacterized protein n=1 Tax=bioreactor metagenome TaxID=1076179 RepID=A0A645GNE3_9ZZZZ